MTQYTADGKWDGSYLVVELLETDLSEDVITGIVAGNRHPDAFTHTVEAESEQEAFRSLAEELDASYVLDDRDGERKTVYDVDKVESGGVDETFWSMVVALADPEV